jgi:hypothetical protein
MALDAISPSEGARAGARLLQAACELVGGEEQLAKRLSMSRAMLRRYIAGRSELPPHLLLRTVDLLLEEREACSPLGARQAGRQEGGAQ